MKTLHALIFLSTALAAGCGGDGDNQDETDTTKRIVRGLAATTESTNAALDERRLSVQGEHYLHLPAEGPPTGRLEWWSYSPFGEDITLEVIAWQDIDRAPHGTRYLVGDDFNAFEATLDLDGVSYPGTVQRFELHSDLLLGVHHATADLRFEPVGDGAAPIELTIDLAGYAEVTCGASTDLWREVYLDTRFPSRPDDPPACVEVFDRIRATPDDPAAPPPPYDLYADDVIDNGPNGSVPAATPPD